MVQRKSSNQAETLKRRRGKLAIVSALVIAANGAMGYFIFTGKIPPENKELAMLYAGSLLAALGGCIAFWTGSSMGSMQKTNLLAK